MIIRPHYFQPQFENSDFGKGMQIPKPSFKLDERRNTQQNSVNNKSENPIIRTQKIGDLQNKINNFQPVAIPMQLFQPSFKEEISIKRKRILKRRVKLKPRDESQPRYQIPKLQLNLLSNLPKESESERATGADIVNRAKRLSFTNQRYKINSEEQVETENEEPKRGIHEDENKSRNSTSVPLCTEEELEINYIPTKHSGTRRIEKQFQNRKTKQNTVILPRINQPLEKKKKKSEKIKEESKIEPVEPKKTRLKEHMLFAPDQCEFTSNENKDEKPFISSWDTGPELRSIHLEISDYDCFQQEKINKIHDVLLDLQKDLQVQT